MDCVKRIERATAARFVSAPFGVRRKNYVGAGGFQNARRGDKSLAQMAAIELRKSVVSDGMALGIGGDAAAVSVAEQNADAHGVRKTLEKRTVLLRIAPRKSGHGDDRLQRGGFVFDAKIPGERAMLVGVNGLHGAFPWANVFVEDATDIGNRMQMQMLADVFVAKAGTQKQSGSMNGAAGYHHRFAVDGNAVAVFRNSLDAGGVTGLDKNFLRARFNDDAGTIFLCVGKPGFGHGLFGANGAAHVRNSRRFLPDRTPRTLRGMASTCQPSARKPRSRICSRAEMRL